MSITSKIVLILTATGSMVAFGYCVVVHITNTFQPLFNTLGAVR